MDRDRAIREYLDKIPDEVYLLDRKGRFVFVNEAFARALRRKGKDLIGRTAEVVSPGQRTRHALDEDEHVLASGEPIVDRIVRLLEAQGRERRLSITKIPRRDGRGRVIGLISATRDVSQGMAFQRLREEKETVERRMRMLDALNRITSEFVSTVSHELRTPLAIVKQLTLLLYDEAAGRVTDRQREILVKIRRNLDRLQGIIDELLDMSRIEEERFSLHYSLTSVPEFFGESAEYFRRLARERHIHLRYGLPRKDVNVFLDKKRVEQILNNLIGNALKYTPKGGHVRVEVRVLEDRIRVGVIDDGPGISIKDRERIFDKFVQVAKFDEVERSGIGLGLPIAKALVEKHGGEIWLESSPRRGSRFYFTLPRFYTFHPVGRRLRERINAFLRTNAAVHLINLQIINYPQFKRRKDISPRRLFSALRVIVREGFREVFPEAEDGFPLAVSDITAGRYSILVPEASVKKVAALCSVLQKRIKAHFISHQIENVFIAVGVLAYTEGRARKQRKRDPGNLIVKEIYIGSEMRMSRRIRYTTRITVLSPRAAAQVSRTLDLSRHGVCFLSRRPMKINQRLTVRIGLIRKRRTVEARCRTAWICQEPAGRPGVEHYRVGMEFTRMTEAHRRALTEELRLYYE